MNDDVKQKLAENPLFQAVLAYAKSENVLFFGMQTLEHREAYPLTSDGDVMEPARHGFSSEDIQGYWMPTVSEYFLENLKNFKQFHQEFGLSAAVDAIQWSTPWSTWTWVVNSTKWDAWHLASKKIKDRKIKVTKENLAAEVAKITDEEIRLHLSESMVQLTPYLWVAPNDPTVMTYDPAHKPYALADGWSEEQMGEILSEWLKLMTGLDAKAVSVQYL